MNNKRKTLVVWLYRSMLLGLTAGLAGPAAANLISDGDFETPVVPAGSFQLFGPGQSFASWTVVGAPGNVAPISGLFVSRGLSFPAEHGAQWLDLTGLSNSATAVQQSVATTAGATYDLSFWVGNQVNPGGIYGVTSTVEVLVNGVSLGLFTNSGGAGSLSQTWEQFNTSFVASGSSADVEFLNRDAGADNTNGLDNIVLLQGQGGGGGGGGGSVPEPATLSLFGVSLAALAFCRRRKAG